jgi:Ni,Fe-hydrogenase I cytochrome b subunit
LHLIGANTGSGFGLFVDALSSPFVALFSSLMQNPVLTQTATLEITTVIAIIVWGIVAWLVGRLMWLVMSRPR